MVRQFFFTTGKLFPVLQEENKREEKFLKNLKTETVSLRYNR